MANRKTRNKQLAKSAEKRVAERKQAHRRTVLMRAGIALLVVAVVAGAFLLVSKSDEGPRKLGAGATPTATVCPQMPPAVIPAKYEHDGPYQMTIDPEQPYEAVMHTSCGQMTIKLLPQQAPIAVNNFVNLARRKWYNGLYFHRVANEIDIIQTGDPKGDGTGGPGYKFKDELTGKERYSPGTVAMANSGPNTNGSQIFIVTGPKAADALRPDYTIFGKLADSTSLDVAKKIQSVPVGGSTGDVPQEKIWIQGVRILEGENPRTNASA